MKPRFCIFFRYNFWKSGIYAYFATLTIQLTKIICTQASLGEVKKKKDEFINLHITVDAEKHLVGTLHPKRLPQVVYNLAFEKDIQISHNWKNGSVHLFGFKTPRYRLKRGYPFHN